MLDLVVRNARIPDGAGGPPLVDIGFGDGRIAAIEPNIQSDAQRTMPKADSAAQV